MAKAKSKAKGKKSTKRTSTLPDGYKVIGRAAPWNVDKNPVIEGPRGATQTVEMPKKKGQRKGENIRRNFVITDETIGAVTVWESTMLKDAFEQSDEGDVLRIEFLGYGEAKKGQNAAKLFNAMKKED